MSSTSKYWYSGTWFVSQSQQCQIPELGDAGSNLILLFKLLLLFIFKLYLIIYFIKTLKAIIYFVIN
jgi:hypothetical protein